MGGVWRHRLHEIGSVGKLNIFLCHYIVYNIRKGCAPFGWVHAYYIIINECRPWMTYSIWLGEAAILYPCFDTFFIFSKLIGKMKRIASVFFIFGWNLVGWFRMCDKFSFKIFHSIVVDEPNCCTYSIQTNYGSIRSFI